MSKIIKIVVSLELSTVTYFMGCPAFRPMSYVPFWTFLGRELSRILANVIMIHSFIHSFKALIFSRTERD